MLRKIFSMTADSNPAKPSGAGQFDDASADPPHSSTSTLAEGSPQTAWSPWVLGLILALAIILVYSNSLHSAFTYDDYSDVLQNTSVRRLWPLWEVVYAPGKGFLSRPVANLSFALDYAFGGPKPFLFHCTNLGVHIGAALALLGVVRRTLALEVFKGRYAAHLATLPMVITALWALHPLGTEAVSYITQRYESLTALFILLTFYCVLRSLSSPHPLRWELLAALNCLIALGSKEVAVSVPILVLLFDRAFIAGSFRRAWRDRRPLYLGMLLAWACFAYIQLHAMKRPFAGFELTTPWWRYALNQPAVILHYLRLAVWPHPLVFDYYWPVAKTWRPLLPGLVAMGVLLVFTGWAIVKKPMLAFLPLFFLAILAPTSSVMPILDLAVEHRMYLPLVPVIAALVLTLHGLWRRLVAWSHVAKPLTKPLLLVGAASLFSALGMSTYLRNEDYRDPVDLWRSVVEAVPDNPRGHNNYGYNLLDAGYLKEALDQYAKAVAMTPGMALFQSNYGLTLARAGQFPEALEHMRAAVRLEPDNVKNIINLGFVLFLKGSMESAETCFITARETDPKNELSLAGLASIMQVKHEDLKARDYIQQAIAINPYMAGYRFQLSQILLNLGDLPAARAAFQATVALEPSAEKLSDYGWTMHIRAQDQEAVSALRKVLLQNKESIKSQIRLAWILATSPDEAVRNGQEAVRLAEQALHSQPIRSPELLDLLAVSLAENGRFQEAQAVLKEALAHAKDSPAKNLSNAQTPGLVDSASMPPASGPAESWVANLELQLAGFKKGQPWRGKVNSPALPQ